MKPLTEFLNEIGIDFTRGRPYESPFLKKTCTILRTYQDKIQLLAYCRTFYSATIVFVRAKRVCAFSFNTHQYHSGKFKALQEVHPSGVSVDRLGAPTKERVEEILAYIQKVIDSPYGEGHIDEDIQDKLYAQEGRIMPAKKFLGELEIKTWSERRKSRYSGYPSARTQEAEKERKDGDPMPFQPVMGGESTRWYGFFHCKNGNVIVYERYNAMYDYAQGPGTMISVEEALNTYKRSNDDKYICRSNNYSDHIWKVSRNFDLPEDIYAHFQTQVFSRALDDERPKRRHYYGYEGDFWVPEQ